MALQNDAHLYSDQANPPMGIQQNSNEINLRKITYNLNMFFNTRQRRIGKGLKIYAC